jgi:hypothetical protein
LASAAVLPSSGRRGIIMNLPFRHATAFAVVLSINAAVGCGAALAAGQRSFVSTSGVDNPACSIAAPCRTLAAAITATSAGGEVIVLDSGGYGQITIAQSVSILSTPGVYAGISVSSGHGVTIATAITDTVVLRGLTISNQGSAGRGIYITGAGVVRVEDVRVAGFTGASGLYASPADVLQLHVRRSVFSNNSTGIALNAANGGTETMQISATFADVDIANNVNGLNVGNNAAATLSHSSVVNNSGRGITSNPAAGQTATVNVDDCEIAGNNQAVYPSDVSGTTLLQISGSRIVNNVTGIATGNLGSTIRVSYSSVANNAYGINIVPGTGAIESAGNNVLRGNANFEPVLTTFPLR